MKIIERLAIANRGEVAVRIIRACKELGIESVLLHSECDTKTLAYRLCDRAVCIGPSPVNESYLNIEANIQAALSVDAEAIHPGFGFLSENPEFAQACIDKRLIFVGPRPESIRLFGDKISAKNLVEKIGVKTIPGYQGENQDTKFLVQESQKMGLPVIVKSASGGGGRGMKIIKDLATAEEAVESAKREAVTAFGSPVVFLEKYLDRAKHIEVQIFVDHMGNVYHLFERECSVQRRHQKIIEESPAAQLDYSIRESLLESAVQIAKTSNYLGAGTIEFLVQDNEYYFMEMNTRLQVEHPVTELVMGVDLVKAQILTAMERGPLWSQSEMLPRGHSIECRIYAEDSYKMGVPSTGRIGGMHWPQGPGRRFDFGVEEGDEVSQFYDSMIAKVIVWDETRIRAIHKMRATLKETVIFGIKTNIPYLLSILENPEFVEGKMTTQFINTHYPNGLKDEPVVDESLVLKMRQELSQTHLNDGLSDGHKSSESFMDGYSVGVGANKSPWTQAYWSRN